MGIHETSRCKSLLIDRVLSVPGFLCVVHAPGFGKTTLLAGLAAYIDQEVLREFSSSRMSPGRTEPAQLSRDQGPCEWRRHRVNCVRHG